MTDLFAARSQMAISLAFHIVFACIGIAMPFLMAVAHWKWLRTKNPAFLDLTQKWSKGVAIFFATGAVSGTVLSFELGLLWPNFMKHAGAIIGMPFSWEGAAFFLEAIALGLFLYGWKRVPPWIHWASGVMVGVCGVLSGLFVVCANAWMNTPAGFKWVNGEAIDIDPWAAMFNPAALVQGVHMTIAAFQATGFAVAGVHAIALLKGAKQGAKSEQSAKAREFHRHALKIAIGMGAVAALIQPLSGDWLAKTVAKRQPAKLAAMESLFITQRSAPLVLGGIPDEENKTIRYGLHIPGLLSFLAHGNFRAEVKGLDRIPREEWPPILPVHLAFQVMIFCGSFLALVGAVSLGALWIRRWNTLVDHPNFLRILAISTPLGFLAIETGWVVTEVGRQPWIIYGIMKTKDAVTPMPGLIVPMLLFSFVYLFLSFVVTWLMVRQFRHVS